MAGVAVAQLPEPKNDFLAYHVLMHRMITTFHQRLMDVTSRRFADDFMMDSASDVVQNLVGSSQNPIDLVRDLLTTYGYQLTEESDGEFSTWKAKCPIAQFVHPSLPSNETICPVTLLLVAATRLQHRGSKISEHEMKSDGSEFTIKLKDEDICVR